MPPSTIRSRRRKFDDPTKPPASAPQRHYYPNTLQDLVDIVQGAEGMPGEKLEVRASGSHWAFSDAAVARGFAVETQDPEGGRLLQAHCGSTGASTR